jgi:hypothetical protein
LGGGGFVGCDNLAGAVLFQFDSLTRQGVRTEVVMGRFLGPCVDPAGIYKKPREATIMIEILP